MTERHTAKLLLAGLSSWMLIASASALPFAARPTLTNGNQVVDIGTWSGKAVAERQVVAEVPYPAMPLAGSQHLCVETIKERITQLLEATVWVDLAQQANESFVTWFTNGSTDFPAIMATGMLAQCALPSDWFENTPHTGMMTNIYAWPGCATVFASLVATRQFLIQRESTYEWAAYLNAGVSNLSGACGGPCYDGPVIVQDSEVLDASGPGPGVWHHAIRLGIGMDTNGYESWAAGGFADRMKSTYRIIAEVPTNYTPRGDAYHRVAAYWGGGETNWPTGYTALCSEVTTNASPYLHPFDLDFSASTTISEKRYVVSSYDSDFNSYSGCGLCVFGSTNFGYPSDNCGDGPWYLPGKNYISDSCAGSQWSFGKPQEADNGYPQEINGYIMTATMLLRWNVPSGFSYVTNAP